MFNQQWLEFFPSLGPHKLIAAIVIGFRQSVSPIHQSLLLNSWDAGVIDVYNCCVR